MYFIPFFLINKIEGVRMKEKDIEIINDVEVDMNLVKDILEKWIILTEY